MTDRVRDVEVDPWLDRFVQLFRSLTLESDRGCVLVVAAMVERALEQHIAARLLPPTGSQDELLSRSANAPNAAFSAKINLAYRLGLFPANERKIYHQLRTLRNECAHSISLQEFSADRFRSRVKSIIEQSEPLWEILRTRLVPVGLADNAPATVREFLDRVGWRVAFELFFSLVVAHKETSVSRVPRLATLFIP